MTGDLSGWIPVRVLQTDREPRVEWRYAGDRRCTEPFFEDTVRRMARGETSIDKAVAWAGMCSSLAPRGFIFHESRCGSTLLTQMLAALPENRVISEPPALDDILNLPDIPDSQRSAWLRAMVNALGQPSTERETNFFIKWDCWLMPQFPLIRQTFPDTPWIFLYREPIEVLASQLRKPGAWIVPASGDTMRPREDYYARRLAGICEAAIDHVAAGGALVNYCQLPHAVCSAIPAWFGVSFSPAQCERMLEAARFDAKTPALTFTEDASEKRSGLPEPAIAAAERWLRPPYFTLERLRKERHGLPATTEPSILPAQLR